MAFLGQGARVSGNFNINVMAASGIAQALRRSGEEVSRQTAFLAEALARRGTIPPELRRAAHSAMGVAAQRAVVGAYASREHASRTPPYRASGFQQERNRRYAGGVLKSALESPNFFDASANGVKLVNERYLDTVAKQWRRLNFGDKGAGGGRSFPIKWDGLASVALRLDDPGGKPGFSPFMPAGYWLNGAFTPQGEIVTVKKEDDSDHGFYAPEGAKRMKRRAVRPIQASNFLDAGVEKLAEQIPIQYGQMYQRLYSNFYWRKDISAAVGITMPRP